VTVAEIGGRLLLLATLAWWGCAGSRPPASLGGPRGAEEFDPQSLQEELLLIQPLFPPPEVPADAAAPDDSGKASALVYRVQIMALTNEATARSSAADLERVLGVPVYVVAERGYHLVRAGRYASPTEAEALRRRIAAFSPNYADAYVVPRQRRPTLEAEAANGLGSFADGASAAPTAGPVFGWRVLIGQFLRQEEAEKLRQEARERLGRMDIDLSFKPPWYRVEVGICRTESEAQTLVEDLQACGYRNALKVRAQIQRPQEAR
jgi:hypothetical protein